MSSALDTMIELRREAEQAARAGLERARAARAAADEREVRLVEVWRRARTALLGAEERRFSGSMRAAQAQTHERHRACLLAEVTSAARDVEQHRRHVLATAHGAEDEARAAYQAARVALAAAEKLALRAAAQVAQRNKRRVEERAADHAHAAHVRRSRQRR